MGRSPGAVNAGCSICIETTRRDQMRPALDVVAGQTPPAPNCDPGRCVVNVIPLEVRAPRVSSVSACVNRLRMTHADTGAGSNQYRVNTRPGRIFQGTASAVFLPGRVVLHHVAPLGPGAKQMALSTANALLRGLLSLRRAISASAIVPSPGDNSWELVMVFLGGLTDAFRADSLGRGSDSSPPFALSTPPIAAAELATETVEKVSYTPAIKQRDMIRLIWRSRRR